MFAHLGCNAPVAGMLGNDVSAVAHMSPQGRLIRFDIVCAEDPVLFILGNKGRRRDLNPNLMSLCLGNIRCKGVGFTRPEYRFDDLPGGGPIHCCQRSNCNHALQGFPTYRGPICRPALQSCRIHVITYLHNPGCQYDNKTLTRTHQAACVELSLAGGIDLPATLWLARRAERGR